jgi:hypothetical protein
VVEEVQQQQQVVLVVDMVRMLRVVVMAGILLLVLRLMVGTVYTAVVEAEEWVDKGWVLPPEHLNMVEVEETVPVEILLSLHPGMSPEVEVVVLMPLGRVPQQHQAQEATAFAG